MPDTTTPDTGATTAAEKAAAAVAATSRREHRRRTAVLAVVAAVAAALVGLGAAAATAAMTPDRQPATAGAAQAAGEAFTVAGVIRCTSSGAWEVLDDAGHEPLGGLRVIGADNQRITIGHRTASKIHALIVAPDETLGGKYHVTSGASAGFSVSYVYLHDHTGPVDPTPCTKFSPWGSTNLWALGVASAS